MPLNDIVVVTITNTTPRITQRGFGLPMLLSHSATFPDLVRYYSSSSAVLDDFSSDSIEYSKALTYFSQNPSVRELAIGRRSISTAAWAQTWVPTELTEGYVYNFSIAGEIVTYTNGAAETVAGVTAGLTASITGNANLTGVITPVDNGTNVSVSADVAGTMFQVSGLVDNSIKITDTTSSVGGTVQDDLDAIFEVNKDWYALEITSQSKADILDAATFAEANERFFMAQSQDADVVDSLTTTDVASTLADLDREYTKVIWHHDPSQNFGSAWLSRILPLDPGSATWELKSLSGVVATPSTILTGTVQNTLESKNVGFYEEIGGISVTRISRMASGEWMDIRRGIDWQKARLVEAIFGLLSSVDKIPYTEQGVGLIENQIRAVLLLGERAGLYVPGSSTVSFPRVADIPVADKANRLLPDGKFTAQLQGAVHSVILNGEVYV